MQGLLEGVSLSANHSSLKWNCDLLGLQNPYKLWFQVFLPFLFFFCSIGV